MDSNAQPSPITDISKTVLYLHGKNVSRVMMSCLSQGTEISACACECSAWRDLARLGKLTRSKLFTWEKVGSPPGSPYFATKWPYPQGHPTPRARFAVSHVNGRWWFMSNCRKTWLALVGSGMTLKLRDVANFGMFFHVMQTIHLIYVCVR